MIQNKFSLQDVLEACGGRYISYNDQETFENLSTDTRENLEACVFFALSGDTFDAHDFLSQAEAKGAGLIVCHRLPENDLKTNVLLVEDTLVALQALATFWRRQKQAKIAAITGTNGKTTTKEFLHQILSKWQPTHASKGSFNNHWGVPLSLLELQDQSLMISEMGMNHRGEIAKLVAIAEPDICLVTNVGRGHLEGMKTLENIALEKSDIYRAAPSALKIFNLDNSFTLKMKDEFYREGDMTFSLQDKEANVYLRYLKPGVIEGRIGKLQGSSDFHVYGEHNLANLAAAACCALRMGMPEDLIWSALSQCKTSWGRNQWVELESKAKVLFDAYNANPESMGVLLNSIKEQSAEANVYLVLGDMLELGEQNESEHIAMANLASSIDAKKVYFIGKNAELFKTTYSKNNLMISTSYEEKLAADLLSMLQPSDTVYMKASRGIKLENFLRNLKPINFS